MEYFKVHLKEQYDFLGENGRDAQLELYLPLNLREMNRESNKRSSIIICPGGGYAECCQREAEPIALNFLNRGYNVFVLWYSVAPNRFPAQIIEVAAAMDLIYKNAEEWHCDTNKIAIMGFSAGGHLACHYSTSFDCKEVREFFPNSYPVNASVLGYPVITAHLEEGSHIGSFINLTGKNELSDNELERFSLEKQVSDKTAPAFIWHTAEDGLVPVNNSLLYANALARHNPV